MATSPDHDSVPFQYPGDLPDRVRNAAEALARSQAAVTTQERAVCGSRAAGVIGELTAALAERGADREELRAAVRSLAGELRGQDVPPEQMVITLRTVILRSTAPGTPERDVEALTRAVLLWGIDAYYAGA